MPITNRIARWGGARVARRLARTAPWIGGVLALATIAATVRRKGMVGGVLDTGFNAVPVLGTAKNVFELARGRDLFPDRP